MNNRTLIGLAGALVVLGALALFGQREQRPQTVAGEILLPGLEDSLDEITSVEIIGAGNTRIATLERADADWVVAERDGYPADLTKTRHALLSFAETTILEAKTANPALHDRLGVEDVSAQDATGALVRILGPADPADPVEVVVGGGEGEYQRYVRRQGEDQSYLINRDPQIYLETTEWLDTTLLDLDSNRVKQVTVTRPAETLVVSKDVRGQTNFTVQDIPEGRELRYESIPNVLGSVLSNLTLDDVQRADGPLGDAIVSEFVTFDGLVITAESVEVGDEAWVSFSASVDPALPEESVETRADAEAEAAEINARVEGWRYAIPTVKFEQLTRSMDDLLREVEEEEG
ncbi:MAG TPA: DUF4340 domain-containing protein [Gammaproteobacteria bacterium]